ncbi:hypothetical protein HN803_06560 [candidate division WWE3 bacterium]|jgi:hypothetical protein|nr:hypothetical protein [candidate division WWE3 bacterium]MBT7350418.1 hypothetical protein [candidate division WWE3 bacterium]
MKFNIRLLYLYLFSFVGLIVIITSTIKLVDLGLKMAFFNDADRYDSYVERPMKLEEDYDAVAQEDSSRIQQTRSRQRDLSSSVSMLVVGVPLYAYHWNLIKVEGNKKKK